MLKKLLVEKFPRIAFLYRNLRDTKALRVDPKMTKLGFKFNGNVSMENGFFEQKETALVKKLIPNVDIVINVGANIGYYVCHALKHGKKVFAFEPIETNVKYLLRNIKANNWGEGCEIFPVACSNKAGIIEIFGGDTSASLIEGWAGISKKYVNIVPCLTMNDVLGDRLNGKNILIILDIEGGENLALAGATKLLDMSPKPIWLVEISVTTHQPKGTKINPHLLETFEMFWDRGYQSFTANDNLRKISKDEIIRIIDTGLNTLETHNFLFSSEIIRN